MKILILEDDLLASDFIEKMISDHFSDCEVVGKATTVKEASKLFNIHRPDLMIMDINLGDHTSFDLFEYIEPAQLNVVFTSSYSEFALKAIKIDAVDYLLKPINIDDFKLAIRKVQERIHLNHLKDANGIDFAGNSKKSVSNKMLVYENEKLNPVEINQILKIKSDGAYSNICMEGEKRITSSRNIGLYAKLLEGKDFIRIHDSCLINAEHIASYTPGHKAYVTLSDRSVEFVSKGKKKDFLIFFRK